MFYFRDNKIMGEGVQNFPGAQLLIPMKQILYENC